MFKEMVQPRPQNAINQLDRQHQSLIFQFRTQHTRTNQHLKRINPQHQPHCRHCDNPAETTEHLLLYCPKLQLKRKELLPTNPTIHSTLYGQLDQLKKTRTSIRLASIVQEWRTQQFGINNSNKTTTATKKNWKKRHHCSELRQRLLSNRTCFGREKLEVSSLRDTKWLSMSEKCI